MKFHKNREEGALSPGESPQYGWNAGSAWPHWRYSELMAARAVLRPAMAFPKRKEPREATITTRRTKHRLSLIVEDVGLSSINIERPGDSCCVEDIAPDQKLIMISSLMRDLHEMFLSWQTFSSVVSGVGVDPTTKTTLYHFTNGTSSTECIFRCSI